MPWKRWWQKVPGGYWNQSWKGEGVRSWAQTTINAATSFEVTVTATIVLLRSPSDSTLFA